jgi:hypothetical protein
MYVPIGPWSDARYTDTRMLVALARRDAEAAIGVLANPNLDNEEVAEVAELAALTHSNLRVAPICNYVMSARTPAQQLTVLMAAYPKSSAAASLLLGAAHPIAARTLLRQCQNGNFRAASHFKRAILQKVAGGTWLHHHDAEATFALYQAALPEFQNNRDGAISTFVSLVGLAQTAKDLLSLQNSFNVLTAAAPEYPVAAINALLLATVDYPQMPALWAGIHEIGMLVMAGDSRQSVEDLDSLDVPENLKGRFNELRAANPATVCAADLPQVLFDSFKQQVETPSKASFITWAEDAASKIGMMELGITGASDSLSVTQVASALQALPTNASGLSKVLLFLKLDDAPSWQLAETFLASIIGEIGLIPINVRRTLLEKLTIEAGLLTHVGRSALVALENSLTWTETRAVAPPAVLSLEEMEARLDGESVNSLFAVGRMADDSARAIHPIVFERITTADQWFQLDALRLEGLRLNPRGGLTARDALAQLDETSPATSAPRYSQLFGNPLGELELV